MAEELNKVFAENKSQGKPTFVAFVTAGYPTQEDTIPALFALEAGGADVIELGIPYSDPTADGPTIQEASTVALKNGTTPSRCLEFVRKARQQGLKAPIILMGYFNPIYKYGEEKMVTEAKEAGANGFIVVDLPSEEHDSFYKSCVKHSMALIPLVAPNSTHKRLLHVAATANSFVYCVSLLGVTGGRAQLPPSLPAFIARVKKHISAPLAIGFGVAERDTFNQVASLADGVVVGSALVSQMKGGATVAERVEALKQKALSLTTGPATPRTQQHQQEEDGEQSTVIQAVERLPSTFGDFGGKYAPEVLMGALEELELAYIQLKNSPQFQKEIVSFYSYVGRPTPLYYAERLSTELKGAKLWFKREDLAHTGAHKINNAIGQALIAKHLGKRRIIAETGAGQHGVATATICAKLGLECVVYMGAEDVQRQSLNVFRMKCMGATVVPVNTGTRTLKDAINEAMRDWVTNINTTHYLIGSAIGPHPFPTIVRDFQSVIGSEAREQYSQLNGGQLPQVVMACVGGGSNSIGMFHPFIKDETVRLIGVEAAGHGVHTEKHSSTIGKGSIGVMHGTKTILLQDNEGQSQETHSISAGLDYPGVGPEHAHLHSIGRAQYVSVDDDQAIAAFTEMAKKEGILPALESSHAISYAIQLAKTMKPEENILVCLSGRGDKDMGTVAKALGVTL